MPNTAGAYQPFGSGWQNLSNYLTKSNLGAVGKGDTSGGAHMERYQNPDTGSQFDDWLAGVNKSRESKDISVKPTAVTPYATPEPKPTRQTPQQLADERRKQKLDEEQDNPYNPYRRR